MSINNAHHCTINFYSRAVNNKIPHNTLYNYEEEYKAYDIVRDCIISISYSFTKY